MTANHHYLSRLVGPLNTVTDDVAAQAASPDDEAGMRRIIRASIVPEFAAWDDRTQAECKKALRYYLTSGNAPFHKILDEQQEWQIDPPTDAKQFFVWIWKELFSSEEYQASAVCDGRGCTTNEEL